MIINGGSSIRLTYDSDPTLFRYRVESVPFQANKEVFDPTRINTHLVNDHAPTQPPYSTTISSLILANQVSRGFNSDKVVGLYMSKFDPIVTVNKLNYPAIGAAWNYFKPEQTGFYTVVPSYPIYRYSPAGKARLIVSQGGLGAATWTPVSAPDFTTTYPKFRVVQPVLLNNPAVITMPNLLNAGFTQVRPGVYEADPQYIPNLGEVQINFTQSAYTTVRSYYLNGDSFSPSDPLLFNEAEFAAKPIIGQALGHINNYPHYGIADGSLSLVKCYSANWLYYIGLIGVQQRVYGGDTWLQSGTNTSHPIEELPNGTLVYWVALYNGEESDKKVVHPTTGALLARPVNGKKRIRCAFTLPAELTPVADPGVLLRRCNPTVGFQYTQLIT